MRVLKFPSRYSAIRTGGATYVPDDNGLVQVSSPSHAAALIRMGATDTNVRKAASEAGAALQSDKRAAPSPSYSPAQDDAPATNGGAAEAPSAQPQPPREEWTREEIVVWLAEHGIEIKKSASKREALAAVEKYLAEQGI